MAKATVYFLPSKHTLLFFPVNNTIIVPALWMLLGKLYLLDTNLLIQGLFQFQLLPYNIQYPPFPSAFCRQRPTKSCFQTHYLFS